MKFKQMNFQVNEESNREVKRWRMRLNENSNIIKPFKRYINVKKYDYLKTSSDYLNKSKCSESEIRYFYFRCFIFYGNRNNELFYCIEILTVIPVSHLSKKYKLTQKICGK